MNEQIVRLFRDMHLDTVAIAARLKLTEAIVYNILSSRSSPGFLNSFYPGHSAARRSPDITAG